MKGWSPSPWNVPMFVHSCKKVFGVNNKLVNNINYKKTPTKRKVQGNVHLLTVPPVSLRFDLAHPSPSHRHLPEQSILLIDFFIFTSWCWILLTPSIISSRLGSSRASFTSAGKNLCVFLGSMTVIQRIAAFCKKNIFAIFFLPGIILILGGHGRAIRGRAHNT